MASKQSTRQARVSRAPMDPIAAGTPAAGQARFFRWTRSRRRPSPTLRRSRPGMSRSCRSVRWKAYRAPRSAQTSSGAAPDSRGTRSRRGRSGPGQPGTRKRHEPVHAGKPAARAPCTDRYAEKFKSPTHGSYEKPRKTGGKRGFSMTVASEELKPLCAAVSRPSDLFTTSGQGGTGLASQGVLTKPT